MTDSSLRPWQIAAAFLTIAVPVIIGAFICIMAQIYWPYHEPDRLRGKDHEDQDAGGINSPEDEQSAQSASEPGEGSDGIELVARPIKSLASRMEEGLEDPDEITALPPLPRVRDRATQS